MSRHPERSEGSLYLLLPLLLPLSLQVFAVILNPVKDPRICCCLPLPLLLPLLF